MPAATPQPSLEDLLIILSRCSGLRINILDMADIHGNVAELCFKFDRRNLGPSADWVFKNPSSIFPALKDFLEFDETLEKAYRDGDPRNTIDDVIAYIEQKIAYTRAINGLSDKMDAAFFASTLKYLRELSRRRRDADRRVKEAEEARRKNTEEEIKRKVEEEIRRREQERQRAKAEAHARWEREEAEKRKWQEKKTDDGSSNRQQRYSNPFEEELRRAGIDPNDPMFKTWWEAGFGSSFGYDFGRRPYENPFGGTNSNRGGKTPPPPPPPGAKRKWFEILGCAPGATRDEIRRAAREAAKGLHPDKSEDPKAKEKFQEISEAKAEGLAGCA